MLQARQASIAVLSLSLASSIFLVAWLYLGWLFSLLILALPAIALGLVLRNNSFGFSIGLIALIFQLFGSLPLSVGLAESWPIASPYIFLAFACLAFIVAGVVLIRGEKHMRKSKSVRPNGAA